MMSAYSLAVANWDHPHHKYGPIVTVPALLPSTGAALTPFLNGQQMRRDVLQGGHRVDLLVLTRDSGKGGRVTLASDVRFANIRLPLVSATPAS